VDERRRSAEEKHAHGRPECAVTAHGERRPARDRADEVAELHRRGPQAHHGRANLGRGGEGECARDKRAPSGDERGDREEECARRDVHAYRAEEAVRDGE
jgi:hypothetical protein